MGEQPANSLLVSPSGEAKSSGAAMLFSVIGIVGIFVCLIFNLRLKKYRWNENVLLGEQTNN